jgi:hypothetical protein
MESARFIMEQPTVFGPERNDISLEDQRRNFMLLILSGELMNIDLTRLDWVPVDGG